MVEKLLENLDASGTLELAEVHGLTLQILQGASGTLKPFKKLVGLIGRQLGQDTLEQQRVMVERVVLTRVAINLRMSNFCPGAGFPGGVKKNHV